MEFLCNTQTKEKMKKRDKLFKLAEGTLDNTQFIIIDNK